MPWTAAAIVGAAVVGAGASSYSSNEAENSQHDAAGNANSSMFALNKQTRTDLAPWMLAGARARDQLGYGAGTKNIEDVRAELLAQGHPNDASLEYDAQREMSRMQSDPNFGKLTKPFGMEDFQASPAYQFNLSQGQMAIDKAAAARGKFYAPATLQDVSKFSQGLASNEFQNAYNNYNTNMGNIWNRLYSLSGQGQNAAVGLGGFGTTVASQVGQNQIGAGNAAAASNIAQGNSVNQGLGTAYNGFLTQQILASNQGSTYNSNPSSKPGTSGMGDLSFEGMA